jgi:hypothetical protein
MTKLNHEKPELSEDEPRELTERELVLVSGGAYQAYFKAKGLKQGESKGQSTQILP